MARRALQSIQTEPKVMRIAHQIMFGGDLTAKHNKIKETEMVRILSIVVLQQ